MKLNAETELDLSKLIETRLLVQANSGGGKSWLIRRILEQTHGKVQQIIIDPEGEFGTLREKFDYILAGKDGDTPAEPRSAALLARRLLELKVSAIIDLYELPPQDRKLFVRRFLDAMVDAPKELYHEVLIVIDEAHIFAPEKGQSEAYGAVIDLCTRGRKRGFCAVLATQRISKLAKDAAAECNNKLIGRTGLDIDMKRAAEELGFTSKEQLLSLRKLAPGEFFAFGPAISDEVIQVKVGEVETSHPKIGSKTMIHVVPPTDAIKKILGKLADLPKEAEQNAKDINELKTENATLKREITLAKKALEDKTPDQGFLQREKSYQIVIAHQGEQLNRISKILETPPQKLPTVDAQAKPIPTNPLAIATVKYKGECEGAILSGPESRILQALVWFESIGIMEPEQTAVAFLAGYTFGGGGFNNPKGSLRSKGFIEYRGGSLALTPLGREVGPPAPEAPLTTSQIQQKVLAILPGPEQRLLRPLLDCYPNSMHNEGLAELAGYAPGSGGFNNPKGRLRSLGLVEYPSGGYVKARSILFID